jgi:hypothetical protein
VYHVANGSKAEPTNLQGEENEDSDGCRSARHVGLWLHLDRLIEARPIHNCHCDEGQALLCAVRRIGGFFFCRRANGWGGCSSGLY